MHFYVFSIKSFGNCYERTCGTESAAEERVKDLKQINSGAFYTVDSLPEKWFY